MQKRGFTLIEIIVAAGIFTTVVTIAIGALSSLNKTSREARAMRVVMDNANAAMDSMTRTIRMGMRFDAGCTNAGVASSPSFTLSPITNSSNDCLAFYGPASDDVGTVRNQRVWYKYNSTNKSVERNVYDVPAVTRESGAPDVADPTFSWERMTAPEVEVSDLRFYVSGATLNQDQPTITIVMKGEAHVSRVVRPFSIQTTVTARTPNTSLIKP
jgi:prepilin-type N-terminal cleavage/methylation domain-containing protein